MLTKAWIENAVQQALAEDGAENDLTAQLIPEDRHVEARVVCREPIVVCGCDLVEATFAAVDPRCELIWCCEDGDHIDRHFVVFAVQGPARSILTAERTALNFLQMLSGTATTVNRFVKRIEFFETTKLLDTRKTIPGYRLAQKYAVVCGGGENHRMGLNDAILIKENHIMACGGIPQALSAAKKLATNGQWIEIEVENLDDLEEALAAGAERILLDNFGFSALREAVKINNGRAKLEASGDVSYENIDTYAETGVDYISVGSITKHIRAVDLSLRVVRS